MLGGFLFNGQALGSELKISKCEKLGFRGEIREMKLDKLAR